MHHLRFSYLGLILIFAMGCGSYRQNILLQTESAAVVDQSFLETSKNNIIQIGDFLGVRVFTKNGERLIDPDFELTSTGNINAERMRPDVNYLVRNDGFTKLPLVGDIKLEGLTLFEAERILQEKYEAFYKNSFVNLSFINKRVILLGAPGGQVIPLVNENTSLAEIIALGGGIDNFGKAHNIRVVRADKVYEIDLTTFDGFRNGNMIVQHGDIIYIEQVRRPFTEFIRENGPIISIITSLASLVAVLISIR